MTMRLVGCDAGLWWSRADNRWVVVSHRDGAFSKRHRDFLPDNAGGVAEAYRLACAFLSEEMRTVEDSQLPGEALPSSSTERGEASSLPCPPSSSTYVAGVVGSTRHGMCTRASGRERGRGDDSDAVTGAAGSAAVGREGGTAAEDPGQDDKVQADHLRERTDTSVGDAEGTGLDSLGSRHFSAKGRSHLDPCEMDESREQGDVGQVSGDEQEKGSSVLWRVKEDTAGEGKTKEESHQEKEGESEDFQLSSCVFEGRAQEGKSKDVAGRKSVSDEEAHQDSSLGKDLDHCHPVESPTCRQRSLVDTLDLRTTSSGVNKICTRGMASASNDRSGSRSGHHLRHQASSALASSVSTALARRRWGSSAAIVASGADAWARQALKLPLYPGMQYDAISKCFRVKLRNHRRAFSVVRRGVKEAHILAVEALMSEGLLDKKNEDDFRSFYHDKELFPSQGPERCKAGDGLVSGEGTHASAGIHTGSTRGSFSQHSRGYREALTDQTEEEAQKAASRGGGSCGARGREESVLSSPTSFSPPARKGSSPLVSAACHGMATRGGGAGTSQGGGPYGQSRGGGGGGGGYHGGSAAQGVSARGSWGGANHIQHEGRGGDVGGRGLQGSSSSSHGNPVGRHSRGEKCKNASGAGGGALMGAAPAFDEEGDKADEDAFLPLGGLGLTKNAIVICLTDMRDNCLPMCFASFSERAERRRMIQRHIAHIQDATRRETVLPYLHLFECLLLLNRLPHEVEYSTQRVLFSALDMHARAAVHTYFPGYFTGSAGALGILWGEEDGRDPVDPSSLAAELMVDDEDYMRQ